MEVPAPAELMALIRDLPAAAPLLDRLDQQPGIYLVGGAVRDLLLDLSPLDLDVAVEGDPVRLAERLGGEIRAHGRFGTCTARLDGATYDFAQTRRERYPYPGSLPEVEPAPLREDLLRRDFTVNALAVPLTGPEAGRVIPAPSTLEDLSAGQLRVLHERSFLDDPTRLLRLARYGARFGFTIEPETGALAGAAIAGGALATVSGERIGAEVRLLAEERDPVAAFAQLRELGADSAIHPQFGLEDPALAARALALLPSDGRPDRLVLAVAVGRLAPRAARALLDSLAFPAADRDVIVQAASAAAGLAERLQQARSASAIAAAVGPASPEAVALAGALGAESAARSWLERLRHVRLSIRGDDLLAAGVTPGPDVGRGLRAALAAKLDGRAAEPAAELSAALGALAQDGGDGQ